MLKMYSGDVFQLEISDSHEFSMNISYILEQDSYEDKMFLLYRSGFLVGAASLNMLLQGDVTLQVFKLEDDFFEKVRDYCVKNKVAYGSAFPLINDFGECEEILLYEQNIILDGPSDKNPKFYESYNDYDFDKIENLDFSLFIDVDSIIFMELEEYTYAIAKLLLKVFPEKRLICLDERMSKFLSNVEYFEALEECLDLKNRIIIFSDKWNDLGKFSDCITNVYNSINVMYSLTWIENRESFGKLYPDSIVFLIDYSTGNAGLVDIMKFTATYVMIAQKRGWIPVVNLNCHPNQYLNSIDDNMWEYFFSPVSNISIEEAYACKNVIRCSVNNIRLNEFRINIFYRKMEKLLFINHGLRWRQIIRINAECLEFIVSNIPNKILDANWRVLGCVARGTDYGNAANSLMNRNRAPIASIDKMITTCKWKMELWNCDYIFLATEDEKIFKKFKSEFREKLLYVNQKRVWHDYTKNYIPVAKLLDIKDGKKFGMTYLSVLYSLSRCNVLLYSARVGAVVASEALNEEGFEACERIRV